MKCETCGKCKAIKLKDEVYVVSCIVNGDFPIHQSHVDEFNCKEHVERVQEPPKENIVITLKCGRDFFMYDKNITCMADLDRMIIEDALEWPEFGNFTFKRDEIACYGYIGG